jgi:hypothetical protein
MTATALASALAGVVRVAVLARARCPLDPHPAPISAIPATATRHRDLTFAICESSQPRADCLPALTAR